MNKAEILQKIESNFESIGSPQKIDEKDGIALYEVPVFETKGDKATRKTVAFYVKGEETENEAAFLRQEVDKPQFLQQVEALIESKEADKTILKGVILETNEDKEYAIIKAYMIVNKLVETKTFFLYKDGGAKFIEMTSTV